ncbi:MAG: adenylate/guanylate cyclase domain-containing protein, partial [Burkholderiales bacterium]
MADEELNVQPVIDWLVEGAPPARLPQDVLLELCRRLVAQGLPLYRVGVFVRTLHPNVLGRGFVWQADRDAVEINEAAYEMLESEVFLKSAIRVVFVEHAEVRRRIADTGCPMDFPILAELREEGGTDFYALPLRFLSGEVHAATFATRRAGGFREAEIAALRRVATALSRVAEIYASMRKARNILDAYLGPNTGERVLAGQIRRGDGQDINAVIWFCDLRDSTPLADSMSRQDFLRLLNEYFECVLGPVLERQGEVLRFIGDAALAIFPVADRPAEACAKALAAARDALARMNKLNEKRQRPLRFGIGLHLGELTYGNIGTPTRI